MAVAAGEEKGFRPGMVAVVQTFGDQLDLHPRVHALVTRGGWTADGAWMPIPYVSASGAEQLFQHKDIRLLRREGLLDEDRTLLLAHVPDPRRHLVHDDGADSNVVRGRLKARSQARQAVPLSPGSASPPHLPPASMPPSSAALRRRWARHIRRVYEVDPLLCPRCHRVMRVVAFITGPRVVRRILDQLGADSDPAPEARSSLVFTTARQAETRLALMENRLKKPTGHPWALAPASAISLTGAQGRTSYPFPETRPHPSGTIPRATSRG
jgi:hypothetical protein